LTGTFEAAVTDPDFLTELEDLRREYAGRPSPLTEAPRFSQYIFQQTGHQVRVLLKREDLNHTGSHKINNVLGQALLTRKMGKRRLIAETGAG
ncbi:tryptophan synthase subunit beta, partial [Salmonella enterica subsp. enterica serovar Infantis]